jgi:hypothetical protein
MTRRSVGGASLLAGSVERPTPSGDAAIPGRRWLAAALVGVSLAVLLSWLFLAVAHVDDRYRMDHVSGVRIALARYVNDGILYPPLHANGRFGGTRFMPLPIALHAGLARMTGEYVVSGKLLSYAAAVGLVGTVVIVLCRLGCPFPFALALGVLVLTTSTGLSGSMNMRADLLPLVLQILAVWIVAESRRPVATVGAASLAGLALVSKLSAVWAPIAVLVWLAIHDRRRAAWFAGPYGAIVVVLLLAFGGASDGRLFQNVFGLSTSGISNVRSFASSPYRLMHLFVSDATTAWAVVPAAGLALWIAATRRDASIWDVGLLTCVGTLLIVLVDVGTGWNQLVDLVVLVAIVAGETVAAKMPPTNERGRGALAPLVALMLIWSLASGLIVMIAPDVISTVRGQAGGRVDPLVGMATASTSVLSEDPYVPVSLGQTPVVLDPFMLPRLAGADPSAVPDLVRRIRARSFDLVVLVEPLEPVDRAWWAEEDFGLAVARAIDDAYAYVGRVQGYFVYEPREPGNPP